MSRLRDSDNFGADSVPDAHDDASLLTVKQVAVRLGCSQANVYALLDSGELPFVSIGTAKGYRVDPADLQEFIDARKVRKSAGVKGKRSRPRLRHLRLPG